MPEVGWGVLGTGAIAGLFVEGLAAVPGARLHAVASRNLQRAEAFSSRFGARRSYGTYEELVGDPDVDVVYVATPNEFHVPHALMALRAGKPVLCEKPFAMDAAGAQEVVEAARRAGLFCMEAMWMRFSPALAEALSAVREGAIGEPLSISAELGFPHHPDPCNRLFAPPGGGALLDLGVYPISLVQAFLGAPVRVDGATVQGGSGVDEQVSAVLSFEGGRLAAVRASIRTQLGNGASIHGTEGVLHLDPPLYFPHRFRVVPTPMAAPMRPGRTGWTARWRSHPLARRAIELRGMWRGRSMACWHGGNGYDLEAVEVQRCLREGLRESPRMPLEDTIGVLKTCDAIRRASGPA